MPLIEYIKRNFHPPSRAVIASANQIIKSFTDQGYDLTLRQIYYRFIALDLFPASWVDDVYNKKFGYTAGTKNTLKNYKRLGDLLSEGRLAGVVDWGGMVDRTRNLRGLRHWDDPPSAIDWLCAQYRIEKWNDQKIRIEVWIEKDALLGIFERVCGEPDIDVSYFSCKGYNSQSEMWNAAQRILWYEQHHDQRTLILQFSDHDPSGIDMERDIRERLELFGCSIVVRRLALTMRQVRRYNLPTNPARESDARYAAYKKKFGKHSWELDALEPNVLHKLIRDAVLGARDAGAWARSSKREKRQIAQLKKMALKFKKKR